MLEGSEQNLSGRICGSFYRLLSLALGSRNCKHLILPKTNLLTRILGPCIQCHKNSSVQVLKHELYQKSNEEFTDYVPTTL